MHFCLYKVCAFRLYNKFWQTPLLVYRFYLQFSFKAKLKGGHDINPIFFLVTVSVFQTKKGYL